MVNTSSMPHTARVPNITWSLRQRISPTEKVSLAQRHRMQEARRRAKGAEEVDVDLEGREVLEDAGTGGTRHVRGWRHLNPENVRLYLTIKPSS